MITVKQLREFLDKYPDEFEVVSEVGMPIIHIVNITGDRVLLSTQKPAGHCLKCGEYVYEENILKVDYPFYCPTCDENMYQFEVEPLKEK